VALLRRVDGRSNTVKSGNGDSGKSLIDGFCGDDGESQCRIDACRRVLLKMPALNRL
jgi:hypothetical protein